MRILSWNSRGLEIPLGICSLWEMIKKEDLAIIFLQETEVGSSFFNSCKYLLGCNNCLAVDCKGRSGGLFLLWKNTINLNVLHYSKSHTHGFIDNGNYGWYFMGIYWNLDTAKKGDTWTLFSSTRNPVGSLWLVVGDFNEILCQSKKRGVRIGLQFRWRLSVRSYPTVSWEIWDLRALYLPSVITKMDFIEFMKY